MLSKAADRPVRTALSFWTSASVVAERPRTPPHPANPHFAVTIQDLGAFDEAAYAVLLDAWCRATLNALSAAE